MQLAGEETVSGIGDAANQVQDKNGAENGLNAKSKNEIPMRSMLKMFGICPMTNTSIHE